MRANDAENRAVAMLGILILRFSSQRFGSGECEDSQHQRPPRPRAPSPRPRPKAITPPAPHAAPSLEPQAQRSPRPGVPASQHNRLHSDTGRPRHRQERCHSDDPGGVCRWSRQAAEEWSALCLRLQRPIMRDYVTLTGPTDGATAPGGW